MVATRVPIRYVRPWDTSAFCPAAMHCDGELLHAHWSRCLVWKRKKSPGKVWPSTLDLAEELVQWMLSLAAQSVLILEAICACLLIWYFNHLPSPASGREPPQTGTPGFYGTSSWTCFMYENIFFPFATHGPVPSASSKKGIYQGVDIVKIYMVGVSLSFVFSGSLLSCCRRADRSVCPMWVSPRWVGSGLVF